MSVEDYATAADAFLRGGKHPTLGRPFHACGYLPMVELLALPRGERLHQLHRLGRRPRLHAARSPRRSTASPRAGDRQLERARATGRRARRHRSRTRRRAGLLRRRPGQARADLEPDRAPPDPAGGNSNGDIPMLGYAGGKAGPRSGCSSSTTTPSASSTTRPVPSSRSRRPADAGLDGGQHQGRLGHRVRVASAMRASDAPEGHGRAAWRPLPDGLDRFYPEEAPVREVSVEASGSTGTR